MGIAAGVAGCSAPSDGDDDGTTVAPHGDGTTTAGSGGGATPGADQLGGPDTLQRSATVRATVLDEDRGAGRFVNTPAVVWVEQGATVTWEIEGAAHSVTAYHPDNDRALRIPEDAASFDSEDLSAGETFEHTFETPGVYDYFCRPHEGVGMVGLVIVGSARGGPGAQPVEEVSSDNAASALGRLLGVAGLAEGGGGTDYGWQAATLDAYWYSLYNMSTNIAMSGNGVRFPHNEQQRQALEERLPKMLGAADTDRPPIKDPYLNMAPFTEGDPSFTEQPVLSGEDGRPVGPTLRWDKSKSSGVVSPASLAWTHLKGVTWAKNFENHFDILPASLAAKFRAQVLTTLAQIGIKAGLIAGGPEGNGALTKGDSLELVSGFKPAAPEVVDDTTRPHHHAAMTWFLADLVSLANGGWFGYVNPEPLIPAKKLQGLSDGMARTTMEAFPPEDLGNTRTMGLLLGATAWAGTHAGSDELAASASEYANGLADAIASRTDGDGRVSDGAPNQAATQGIVGQGLAWASELDGVDRTDRAETVLGYLLSDLWDGEAGTFASGVGETTYRITARDAGDLVGGLNAADAVLGMDGAKGTFATFFDETVNRGRLQRAQRSPSTSDRDHEPPLPPAAGGEYGQAAVSNGAVEYDVGGDSWSVVDDTFDTEQALYLANQEIWISQWAGDFFAGRGVPGQNDTPG